jgi:hypothetical protein
MLFSFLFIAPIQVYYRNAEVALKGGVKVRQVAE